MKRKKVNKKVWKIAYYVLLFVLFCAYILVVEYEKNIEEQNVTEELDELTGLPKINLEKYNNEETIREIMRIFTKEGVHLQQSLYIPLVSGLTINSVTEGSVPFTKYGELVKLIANSTSYHIDEYAKFETDNALAKEYHNTMVEAARKFHNSMVMYYSSLVLVEKELVVNQKTYDEYYTNLQLYYNYIGQMEQVMEYAEKLDSKLIDDYYAEVDKVLKETHEDLLEKIK